MKKEAKEPFLFGNYLKELRARKGVSLKKVEEATGISNAYLSQLETGVRRRIPTSKRLNALADYYNVSILQLLQKAGYLEKGDLGETREEKIKKEFLEVINNPIFKYGTRLNDNNDLDYMLFVNEVYRHLARRNSALIFIFFALTSYKDMAKEIGEAGEINYIRSIFKAITNVIIEEGYELKRFLPSEEIDEMCEEVTKVYKKHKKLIELNDE
jgi:transcriptional regulator with XRE-family HTH domain